MGRPAWGSQGAIHSKLGASHGTRRHTPGLPVFWSGHVLSPWTASGELFSSSPGRGRSFVCTHERRANHRALGPSRRAWPTSGSPFRSQRWRSAWQLPSSRHLPFVTPVLQAPTALSSGRAEPRPLTHQSAAAKKPGKNRRVSERSPSRSHPERPLLNGDASEGRRSKVGDSTGRGGADRAGSCERSACQICNAIPSTGDAERGVAWLVRQCY
jgi:hypothetical protein